MPGRSFNSGNYRHGFNGKENDHHWGDQLIQDYGFRLYNPAIAKFLSVDPLTRMYPMLTPYQFASNSSIANIDLDGLEASSSIRLTASDGSLITIPADSDPIIITEKTKDLYLNSGNYTTEEFYSKYPKNTLGSFTVDGHEFYASYHGENGEFTGYYSHTANEYYNQSDKPIKLIETPFFKGYTPLLHTPSSEGIFEDPTSGVMADAMVAKDYASMASGTGIFLAVTKKGVQLLGKGLKGVLNGTKKLFQRYKIDGINHTADGMPRVKATKGNKKYDITEGRVKEYVPEPRAPSGWRQASFKGKNAEKVPFGTRRIGGAGKGKKRTPSLREKRLLRKAHKNCPQCKKSS
ncbi:RHS repeat-associated core domain-containing protein [Aureispira sp. CCB-E]|uniref:RHS repeat domain-containing protein n=1 Tax=Aureispira sp. CCB-E TaxID=3051121 RepID=UPI00286977F5|nr:RHS repeat-associated core domain-containing protein [Aureispira sp. CCB-E]WMX16233.1 RHS repeat-associated core domain-containing protein [Aureispira sp. CCB-E]